MGESLEQRLTCESCSSIDGSYYLKQEMSIPTIWKKYATCTQKKERLHWGKSHLSPRAQGWVSMDEGPPTYSVSRVCLVEEVSVLIKGEDTHVVFDTWSTRRDSKKSVFPASKNVKTCEGILGMRTHDPSHEPFKPIAEDL